MSTHTEGLASLSLGQCSDDYFLNFLSSKVKSSHKAFIGLSYVLTEEYFSAVNSVTPSP